MKKVVFFICVLFFANNSRAQFAGSQNLSEKKANDSKENLLIMDLGMGLNSSLKGTTLSIGLHDVYKFNPNIGWDILSVNAITSTGNLKKWMLQPMTGLYVESNKIAYNLSFYADLRAGYAFTCTDINDNSGACLDVGVGVNVASFFSLGYGYNYVDSYDYSARGYLRYHFLRIGYIF